MLNYYIHVLHSIIPFFRPFQNLSLSSNLSKYFVITSSIFNITHVLLKTLEEAKTINMHTTETTTYKSIHQKAQVNFLVFTDDSKM